MTVSLGAAMALAIVAKNAIKITWSGEESASRSPGKFIVVSRIPDRFIRVSELCEEEIIFPNSQPLPLARRSNPFIRDRNIFTKFFHQPVEIAMHMAI